MAAPLNLWHASHFQIHHTPISQKSLCQVYTPEHVLVSNKNHWIAIVHIQAFSHFAAEGNRMEPECCGWGGSTYQSKPRVPEKLSMTQAPRDLDTRARKFNTYSSDPQTTCQQRVWSHFKRMFSLSNKGWKVSPQAPTVYIYIYIYIHIFVWKHDQPMEHAHHNKLHWIPLENHWDFKLDQIHVVWRCCTKKRAPTRN